MQYGNSIIPNKTEIAVEKANLFGIIINVRTNYNNLNYKERLKKTADNATKKAINIRFQSSLEQNVYFFM